MKGLIYKEFLLGKKNYLGFLAFGIGVAILGVLVGLGTRFGNLQDYTMEDKNYFYNMFAYFTYVLLLLVSAESCTSIARDKTSGWKKIEYTMPVSAVKRGGAWYLVGGMVLAGCFLAGLMNTGLMALMFGQAVTETIIKNMALILLGFVMVFCIILPLYQRFDGKSLERTWCTMVVVCAIVVLIVALVIGLKYDDPEQLRAFFKSIVEKAKEFIDGFFFLSPITMPLLLIGSFALSVRWYQRRGK